MKLIGMMLEQRHGRYIKFFRRTDLPQCHFFPLDRDDVDGRRSALRILFYFHDSKVRWCVSD
jgi:hypothetical protein